MSALRKPEYLLYQETVGVKQNLDMSTESFEAYKRMMFTQLPTEHSEMQQLDMVFEQLNIRNKERIPRCSVSSFIQVLKKSYRRQKQKARKAIRNIAPEHECNSGYITKSVLI